MNRRPGKHIVIIGPAHPLRGGLASYDERLAFECNRLGHRATIYTFSYQYPGFLFPGTTQYSLEPAPRDLDIKVKINSVNPVNWLMVGNELKNLRPDIIIVRYWLPFMGPCLGTILRRVKKNGYTKIICIADNVIPHEKRPGDTLFTKYFLKPIDGFITMSEKVLGQLKMLAADKPARFIPHPLYDHFGNKISKAEARKYLNIETNNRIVLFFGFIRKYKGLDLLLTGFKSLIAQPENKNLKLLIAGEFYEDEKNYAHWLQDPILKPHLILHTQFISDSEVKYFLCAADCVVQPYRSATQSGVTPLAYHFEIPMIVTDVGGLPAMVPHGKVGLIAQPTPRDIADKIERFFALDSEPFVAGIQQEKTKYRWDVMVDTILSLSGNAED